jgi:small subunit ribosomal protein S1
MSETPDTPLAAVPETAPESASAEPAPEAPPEAGGIETEPVTAQASAPEPAAAESAMISEGGGVPASELPGPDEPLKAEVAILLQAMADGAAVEGKVFGWNQGGFHVLLNGVLAFCPRSEIEAGNPKSPKHYLEKSFRFQVIDYRKDGHRFTVSRAGLVREEKESQAAATREKLAEGAVLEGRVSSLTNFGAFVDLGGIEGMVHVSEIAWKPVANPKDVLKAGKKVQVKVLKIEDGGKRISLSMKALEDNPWSHFADAHPRGSEFAGTIKSRTEFGIFVEIEPGMEGLVHLSALPLGMKLENPAFDPGQEVKGWIKEIESKRQRISLTMREIVQGNPWKDIEERYPEGTVVQGTVEEVTPFGAFISIEPGLTGLLPTSEMGLARGTHPGRAYTAGHSVSVQVARIDTKRKRISLVPEGAQVGGSQTDYRDYLKKSQKGPATTGAATGLGAMAAAFAKLQKS